jgi:SnoaL-like protein
VHNCAKVLHLGRELLNGEQMGLTRKAFAAWMEKYGRAWEARDAEAGAELYAENGTYQVTPFVEPMQGRGAILEYWTHVAQTQENIQFGYEILALTPEHGIARWRASFVIVPQQLKTKLDGIFVIVLDERGKCLRLREWWHKHQTD